MLVTAGYEKEALSLVASFETWWLAKFGYGRIFFQASSASQAQAMAMTWGKENNMGRPDVVKKTEKPQQLDKPGYFIKKNHIYIEQ